MISAKQLYVQAYISDIHGIKILKTVGRGLDDAVFVLRRAKGEVKDVQHSSFNGLHTPSLHASQSCYTTSLLALGRNVIPTISWGPLLALERDISFQPFMHFCPVWWTQEPVHTVDQVALLTPMSLLRLSKESDGKMCSNKMIRCTT